MIKAEDSPFVPVLTVMVDYGNAPFLWLVDAPDQTGIGCNICNGTEWDDECPMSEGLWQKFAHRAIEFDRTAFYSDRFDANSWDWIAFHKRGLQLARWLKEEVGETYRVVYDKPCEDPNHAINECTEIIADGSLLLLPAFGSADSDPVRFCQHIVSGGQTGVDRAALDFAMKHGCTHGGWAPQGREAEDGKIAMKYQLLELEQGGYRQRTRRNVQDSDGTLIINCGELTGGTLATKVYAQRLEKPCLVVQLDDGVSGEIANSVLAWLHEHVIKTLNCAGPRESKIPGIYLLTRELLEAVDRTIRRL